MSKKKIPLLTLIDKRIKAPISNDVLSAKICALISKYKDDTEYNMGKKSAYNDVLLIIKGEL